MSLLASILARFGYVKLSDHQLRLTEDGRVVSVLPMPLAREGDGGEPATAAPSVMEPAIEVPPAFAPALERDPDGTTWIELDTVEEVPQLAQASGVYPDKAERVARAETRPTKRRLARISDVPPLPKVPAVPDKSLAGAPARVEEPVTAPVPVPERARPATPKAQALAAKLAELSPAKR